MLYIITPTFSNVRNSTTDVPTWLSIFLVSKKRPNSPKYGKHRAKQELETVPPQELETVPPKGPKNDP